MDKKVLTKIEQDAKKAAEKWLLEKSQNIEETVNAIMDSRAEYVVNSILGFGLKEYNYWQIDNCNGRSGESAAGDWFRNKLGDGVKDWLNEQVGKLPKLSEETIRSIRAEYKEKLEEEVRIELAKRLRCRVEEEVNTILKGL